MLWKKAKLKPLLFILIVAFKSYNGQNTWLNCQEKDTNKKPCVLWIRVNIQYYSDELDDTHFKLSIAWQENANVFSTKWCIYYCEKFGKYIIHLVVTNLEWIKQLIWKTVKMTIEWNNEYAIIDPGTWFIFRNFSSFIKRIASSRIMIYSFNCVPKPLCTEILNCLGPLTNSMCNWATDRRSLFIVRYFSTMCVDVWVQVVFKIWVNFYMPPEDLSLPWL